MKNLLTALIAFTLVQAGIQGCAHAPKSQVSKENPKLYQLLKDGLSTELNREEGSPDLQKFDLVSVEEKSGKTQVVYQFTYETNTKETGRVTHRIQSIAYLEKSDKKEGWKILGATPQRQELIYHEPHLIRSKKKLTGQ